MKLFCRHVFETQPDVKWINKSKERDTGEIWEKCKKCGKERKKRDYIVNYPDEGAIDILREVLVELNIKDDYYNNKFGSYYYVELRNEISQMARNNTSREKIKSYIKSIF